ncbi:hypothetical protein [Desulfatitalea alkaliphila]|uniref:GIY-YIG domain-containing protein n=1 Tax=Desulfatitalea alkaliphila TaxID=2929485 RepID=A0AA41UM76_9BACT|nr:hypothetical protein [Desulfatitalea alkaliphila]MCJ8503142.1 hypothetical protein [Desulfatitalea alkaliphila]
MISGILDLKRIHQYAKCNKEIPHRTNDKAIYRPLKSIIDDLVFYVPEISGWYFWVNANGLKQIIYVGKSDANTEWNLKKRIEEGISEGLEAFWGTHYDKQEVFETMLKKYNYKYENNHKKALKKTGVTHIIWIGTRDNIASFDIKEIEKYLIFNLQPTANSQHKKKAQYTEFADSEIVKNQFEEIFEEISFNG